MTNLMRLNFFFLNDRLQLFSVFFVVLFFSFPLVFPFHCFCFFFFFFYSLLFRVH